MKQGWVKPTCGCLTPTSLICIAALAAYLAIVYWLQVTPFSDFLAYYNGARWLRAGTQLGPFAVFLQPPGYYLFLATLFAVSGSTSIYLPQVFNAVTTSALGFVLWRGRTFSQGRFGTVGLVLFLTSLNTWLLVPVLGTEILFAALFLLGLDFAAKALISSDASPDQARAALRAIAGGLCLGLSQAIRPVTIPFLVLLIGFSASVALLRRWFGYEDHWGAPRSRIWRFLLLVLLVTTTVAGCVYSAAGYGMRVSPVGSGTWSRFVAFNAVSARGLTPGDSAVLSDLIQQDGWDFGRLKKDIGGLANERVASGWLRQVARWPRRVWELVNPAALTQWSIDASPRQPQHLIYPVVRVLRLVGFLVFAATVIAAARWLFAPRLREREVIALCFAGSGLLYLAVHAFVLEVQARYSNHIWLLIFWLSPLVMRSLFPGKGTSK